MEERTKEALLHLPPGHNRYNRRKNLPEAGDEKRTGGRH